MPATSSRPKPVRASLNIRIKPTDRGLIDRAARLAGKTRTDFVLDAARSAAVAALSDRTLYTVDAAAFARFAAALDAAPAPNEKLRRTMRTAAPRERT